MSKIGDAPCMGCEDRHFACHGQCSKYQEFREERNRQNAERVKIAEMQYNPKLFSKSKRENYRKRGK